MIIIEHHNMTTLVNAIFDKQFTYSLSVLPAGVRQRPRSRQEGPLASSSAYSAYFFRPRHAVIYGTQSSRFTSLSFHRAYCIKRRVQ